MSVANEITKWTIPVTSFKPDKKKIKWRERERERERERDFLSHAKVLVCLNALTCESLNPINHLTRVSNMYSS